MINLKSIFRINLNFFILLLFILIPMQSFVLNFGRGIYFSIFSILISLFYLFLLINKFSYFLLYFKLLFKIKTFVIFFVLILWFLFSAFINILTSNFNFNFLYYLHHYRDLFFAISFVYLLPSILYFNNISFKRIYKYLIIMLLTTFVIGLISFFASAYNITFFQNIVNFVSNKYLIDGFTDINIRFWAGAGRAYSIFNEPSEFAQFIFIFLPIIYNLSENEYNFFKLNILNVFIRKYLILLVWVNLLLTKSPIFLVLNLVITVLYYKEIIFKYIKKHIYLLLLFSVFIISSLIIFILINKNQIESLYIYRIYKTFLSLGSFDKLILLEPSLATRIVAYVNSIRIFLENFLFGVGFYNSGQYFYDAYLTSPISITMENISKVLQNPNNVSFSRGLFYTLLMETGIIGGFLWSWFVYLNYRTTKIMSSNTPFFLSKGLRYSIIAIIINSFYNLYFERSVIWIIFSLILLNEFYYKYGRKK